MKNQIVRSTGKLNICGWDVGFSTTPQPPATEHPRFYGSTVDPQWGEWMIKGKQFSQAKNFWGKKKLPSVFRVLV